MREKKKTQQIKFQIQYFHRQYSNERFEKGHKESTGVKNIKVVIFTSKENQRKKFRFYFLPKLFVAIKLTGFEMKHLRMEKNESEIETKLNRNPIDRLVTFNSCSTSL